MDKCVLIIDDQIGIRILLEEIIKSEGHPVFSFESVEEALESIDRKKPSLIITDFWLPIMNGAELISRLEEQDIYIPTIVMSGLPEEAKEKTAHLQSVHKILAKPFNVTQVKQLISEML
ncbi:response regulator [Paraliobacillus salinarum]|uniref:response regulator n=1 Tax=Paraliobacillus salinarum TaxID=1158996 RepID=UPI0015F59689|nr:response regulator [Paraliobacillus salinarum]